MSNHGSFSGNPKTEWLVDPAAADRDMALLFDFAFTVMFFYACRAGGCGPVQARILYAGVRIGAWASKSLTARSMSRESLLLQVATGPSPESTFMQGKLSQISREMEGLPDEPSIAQLDAAIRKHLKV